MAGAKATETRKGIGDEAVRAKTGRTWTEWFRVLDRAGAARMTHARIAAHLHAAERLPAWWGQMVAVRYEQERGMRSPSQTCAGDFAASGSRVLAVPLAAAWKAWSEESERRRWLPDAPLVVTTATARKSLRARWGDTKGRVAVNFYAKGAGRSQVAVDHKGLADAAESARFKAYWAEALDRLRARVEG